MKRWLLPLVVWNAFVFGLYAYDKWAAKVGRRRIRESTLLLCAFVFGTPGAMLAMRTFRHKTRKTGFTLLVTFSLFTNLVLAFFSFVR